MLTIGEKILFFFLVISALGVAYDGFMKMWKTINRGQGELHWNEIPKRVAKALEVYMAQTTVLKTRPMTSLLHVGVVWGFTFYFLINLGDLLEAFIPNFHFLGDTVFSDVYLFIGDVLSVAVLAGVIYFVLRRFYFPAKADL